MARGALSKGRSTSVLLQPWLRRSAAFQVGFDLYPVFPFCPTRLNTADDPTRDVDLRPPVSHSIFWDHPFDSRIMHRTGLKRFAANWVRLILILLQVHAVSSCHSGVWQGSVSSPCYLDFDALCFRSRHVSSALQDFGSNPWILNFNGLWLKRCNAEISCKGSELSPWIFDFDGLQLWAQVFRSTKQGPGSSLWILDSSKFWRWPCDFLRSLSAALLSGLWIYLAIFLLCNSRGLAKTCLLPASWSPCIGVGAPFEHVGWTRFGVAAMAPGSALEKKRALQRQGIALSGDRVALEVTRVRRLKLLNSFRSWLWTTRGVSLSFLLTERPADPEKIAKWLVEFGKELYKSGKAYNTYAETINAVAGARTQIKRHLTSAWDYAFSWIANEPFDHHPAMPPGILVALMSLALLWGWPQVAAVFGLAWAGVLRIGEVLQATRADLVLPEDAIAGTSFALLKIREPKTRGRHAKHQAARIDPVDVIQVLRLAYGKVDGSSPLWPQSSATLRKRLKDLLRALKLPTEPCNGQRPFDLSSFRPGGASWLLMSTENVELVRRRGRWLSNRTMEIYLQEVQYCTYLERLPRSSREMIDTCTAGFADVPSPGHSFHCMRHPHRCLVLLAARKEGYNGGLMVYI